MLIKEKSFYRQLLAMVIPIALQNLIGFGVSVTDTVMVGRLGDMSLSGTALANQPFFVFMIFGFGLSGGGTVLISQYWGKGEKRVVRRVIGMTVRFLVLISLMFAAVCHFYPEAVLKIFSSEEAVIAEGARYLKWAALSYPLYSLTSGYLVSMRAVERVKFPMLLYGISFLVNLSVNWIFIFGKFGAPALGVVGAAVGTVAARATEFLLALAYSIFFEDEIGFKYSDVIGWENKLLPDYLKHSLPVAGSELLWSLGTVVQAAFIGHIGSVFVTADSIARVVQQLAQIAQFGLCNAAGIIIGKTIGQGREKYAKQMGRTLLLVSVIFGIFSAAIVFAVRGPMPNLYNVTEEAKQLSRQIITVMAVMMIPGAVEVTCIVGILRGAGDTKVAFLIDIGCLWLVGVPLGYLAGFVWKLPAVFVYLLMRADIPARITASLIRIFGGKYIKNVTRELDE